MPTLEALPFRPLTKKAALLALLDMEAATGIAGAAWQQYQADLVNDESRFSIDNKARQIGYSWATAAESVGICLSEPKSTCVFVSYNLEESTEKIRYAGQILEALPDRAKMEKARHARTSIEFANGSRIISLPARGPRGKGPAYLYLDELAHCMYDRDIYNAGIHMIQRGGRVRIGSTPLGESGIFWEILTEALQPYPKFRRRTIPWWHVQYLCTDVPRAAAEAPEMTTHERVFAFGTEILRDMFEQKALESFQEELECLFIDESVAWITWPEIQACEDQEAKWRRWVAEGVGAGREAVDKLKDGISKGQVGDQLFAGVDIGRTRDLTEIIVLDRRLTSPQTTQRLLVSLRNCTFREQTDLIDYAMAELPIKSMLIDCTGLGSQLAEERHAKWGTRCTGFLFTLQSKHELAVHLKLGIQRKEVVLIANRDQAYQLHSIKRKVTGSNNVVFDVDASEQHHCDKAWALALAIMASGIIKVSKGGFEVLRRDTEQVTDEQWKTARELEKELWAKRREIERKGRKGETGSEVTRQVNAHLTEILRRA